MTETPYYSDLLGKLVGRAKPISHDELCCYRKDYETFVWTMEWLMRQGFVEIINENGIVHYISTEKGNTHMLNLCKERRARYEATKDPNSIQTILDKLNTCWIDMACLKPEDATELKITDALPCIRFVTVLVKDDEGHVAVANRCLRLKTGNQYLDANVDTFDWHWSNLDFVPTYWMPIPR
jgi:hypothetical protein